MIHDCDCYCHNHNNELPCCQFVVYVVEFYCFYRGRRHWGQKILEQNFFYVKSENTKFLLVNNM